MRILHVLTTLDVGGAEMHVLTQARGQVQGLEARVERLPHRGHVHGVEHEQVIAEKLAWVMCGGKTSQNVRVSEQYLLDLEREAFIHLLGTDHLGRDMLSMTMVGARTSIMVALVALAIGLSLGVPLGLAAAATLFWFLESFATRYGGETDAS